MSINWNFRPNTQDEDIYREVYVENCYRLPDDMSGITVIDVGANIGCFTIACLERSADYVIAYEPDFANQMQLREHLLRSQYKNVQDIGRFVAGDSWKNSLVYRETVNYQKHGNIDLTGAVNLFEYKADPLDTSHLAIGVDSIKSILNSIRGRRIWIKLDCEGAEYQILSSDLPWNRIERIFGECHDYRDGKFSRDTAPVEVPLDAFGGLKPNRKALFARLKEVGYNRIIFECNPEDDRLMLFWASREDIAYDTHGSLGSISNAVSFVETNQTCSQCGQLFSVPACGPTHALIAHERGLDKKSVAVLTPFRDARRYLPLYFRQISALKSALEAENMRLRLVAAEGDSTDGTRERIVELASEYNIPLETVDTTHGHMRWGSVEDPIRMKVMSDVMNKALDVVKESDDIVVWIMSDLKWRIDDVKGLIDSVSVNPSSIYAPLALIDNDYFWDTWAYRMKGERFSNNLPFHEDLDDDFADIFDLESAGTCLCIPGNVARTVRASNEEAVSFCQNARWKGFKVTLNSNLKVYHAPQSSARLLWIGDAVCISGFARVTHNILPVLSEAGYDIDVIATNYQGTPHNYPYRIWPAGEDSGAYLTQRLVRFASEQGKQYDAVIVLDDPWNVSRITSALEDLRERDKIENLPPVIAWVTVDGKNIKSEKLNSTNLYHVSSATAFGVEELINNGFVGGYDLSVTPFGVNTHIYHPLDKLESRRLVSSAEIPDDAFIVGAVSTNQLRKRLDLILKYFAEWNSRLSIENAYLYLCLGAANDTGCDVISLVRYYGLRKKVILNTSLLNEQAMAHVYSSFDVFVSLSQGEGFGLCALEAMACGVPCVLSNWSGYSSWVPDDCAIKVACSSTALSSPLNAQAYVIGGVADRQETVSALHRLYTFPDMRERLRENGLSLASRMSWKDSGKKLLNVIDKVTAQNTASKDSSNGVKEIRSA